MQSLPCLSVVYGNNISPSSEFYLNIPSQLSSNSTMSYISPNSPSISTSLSKDETNILVTPINSVGINNDNPCTPVKQILKSSPDKCNPIKYKFLRNRQNKNKRRHQSNQSSKDKNTKVPKWLIGGGSYGVVFQDKNPKFVNKICPLHGEYYIWIKEILYTRFLDHPNIIKVQDVNYDEHYIYDIDKKKFSKEQTKRALLKMDKYDCDLAGVRFKLNHSDILFILDKISNALLYAHNKGILHLDVKESNIFVNVSDNSIKDIVLGDWGLSRIINPYDSNIDYNTVSISHRPPELFTVPCQDNKIFSFDSRVDVWSFGIVLAYLMTGKSFYYHVESMKVKYKDLIAEVDCFSVELNKFIINNAKIHLQFKDGIYSTLYADILNLVIMPYEDRCYIDDICNLIQEFKTQHLNSESTFSNVKSISSISYIPPNQPLDNLQSVYTLNSKFKLPTFTLQKERHIQLIHLCSKYDDIGEIPFKKLLTSPAIESNMISMLHILASHIINNMDQISLETLTYMKFNEDIVYASCYLLMGMVMFDLYMHDPIYKMLYSSPNIINVSLVIMAQYNYYIIDYLNIHSYSNV